MRRANVTTLAMLIAMTAVAHAQPAGIDDDAPAGPPAPEIGEGPQPKDPKVVKTWQSAGDTLIKRGDALVKEGKTDEARTQYENAVTAYSRAIAASDDPNTLRIALATAQDKAGDTPGAMKTLKALLASGAKAEIQKKAQAKLDEVSMNVGLVTLTVVPDGTQISMGGQPVGESPMSEPLVLAPGTHVVSFSAGGYKTKDVELKVEAGSESERKIELEPNPAVIKRGDDSVEGTVPEYQETRSNGPSKLPLYVGASVTGALVLTATITGIAAIGKHNQFNDATDPTERDDLASSGKTLAHVTDACIVASLGAAAFTTYWYLVKYKPAERAMPDHQAQAKIDVVPWVQPDVGGLAAVGSF